MFGPTTTSKKQTILFTPSPRLVEKKINELQAMIFDEESAGDAEKLLAPPKRMILQKN